MEKECFYVSMKNSELGILDPGYWKLDACLGLIKYR
jgi:hypothetical protein